MNVKFISKEEKLKIISASVLAGTFLISGCSNSFKKNNNADKTIQSSDSIVTESNVSESISMVPETSETIEEAKVYDFMWGDAASQDFSNYLEKTLGMNLATYVHCFGFTDDLNEIYSEYMEKNYGTEGKVSFKTSNYFFTFLDTCDADGKRAYRNFRFFKIRYLNDKKCINGTFNNKFIMSYLCQNELKLGYTIPVDNFKAISADYISICKQFDAEYYFDNRLELGNQNNHNYSVEETLALMKLYNSNMLYIYFSESMKDFDILSKPEAVEAFNQNLKEFYGENAPQIGQVVTVEQYRAMFGEDPLDLSYIPGAIVNDAQVKGNAQVRYADSLNDYSFTYPTSTYDYYMEEPESTGRSR